MLSNVKLIGRYSCLTLILFMLSEATLYASDAELVLDATYMSFDGEEDSTKSSRKGRKKSKKKSKKKSDILIKDTLDVNAKYEVVGGVLTRVGAKKIAADSIAVDSLGTDSTQVDSISMGDGLILDTLGVTMPSDTITQSDSIVEVLTKRELRRINRESDTIKHNKYFRDSIPISRMTAISLVVPGFSQLYNDQLWKIPILYTAVGTTLYFGIKQNKEYSGYKSSYDAMLRRNASRDELTPVQTKMIQHNTYRQILFAGALLSYVYFISDGVVNYDGSMTSVKKATTLSTIFPGLGQFYNKSYWKTPIIIGAFASMAYIIDFNSRGYSRFKLAYDLRVDGDDSTVDEFGGRYSGDYLNKYKKSYRRNRDLAIIGTIGLYLLNIVDAHVDAHLQDYDISDDLALNLEPMLTTIYSQNKGNQNLLGMSLSFTF